jgi:carbon storage regulator
MLVLSRKPGEKVIISGGITITVVKVQGNQVRVGIEAPEQTLILRGELACWHQEPADSDEPANPEAGLGDKSTPLAR